MGFVVVSLLVFVAAGACGGMLAGLVQLARRDLGLLRGHAISVRARVTGFERLPEGEMPVYAFTTPEGRAVTVLASGRRPPVGSERWLVYLPGREHEARPAGYAWRLPLYPALAAGVGLTAWFVVRLVAG